MGGWMAKNINSTKAVVGGVQSTKGRALAQNHLVSAHLNRLLRFNYLLSSCLETTF